MREGYSYRILISYPTYNTYILEFVPYSANSPYTFKLSPSSSFEFSSIFNYAYYYYSPASSQLNSTPSTFSLTSVSNNGTILSTSITCNGFNDNVSGSPTGSSVSVSLNVNSTSVVRCKFDIDVDEYGLYSFNQTYRYLNQTNTSFVSQSEQTRNNSNSAWLTIFSFIIIILMCVGASQMSGNPKFIKGVGILGIIIFTSISWIHPVAGGVSAFIGLLLLFMEGR
jgi:hypothetical protein